MLSPEVHAHPARFSSVMPLQFRRSPLLYTAVALAAGVAASHAWRPGALLVLCTTALAILATVSLQRSPRLATAIVLLTWLLLGWTLGVLHPRPLPDRTLLPYADGLRRDVLATVVAVQPLTNRNDKHDEDPHGFSEQAADQEDRAVEPVRYSVDLQLREIEQLDPDLASMQSAAGTVRLVVDDADARRLQCGSDVRATARMYRPREFRDPGVWRYADWLAQQQIAATGVVVPGHLHAQALRAATWPCRLQQTRLWAAGRLRSFANWQSSVRWLPDALRWNAADVAAWNAMLFGDRTALTHTLRADFERTGTFHLFVVSGMHIGLVAALVFWLAERLRCSRLLATVLTALATTGYALLTGFGEPVQRALFMTVVFLAAQAIGRERNALNAIGAAVLGMLLARPQALWDSGFQMTALIALTIAGIAVPLLERTIAPYAQACRNLDLLRLDRRLPPRVAQFRVRLRWFETDIGGVCGRGAARLLHLAVVANFAAVSATVVALLIEFTMALPMALYFHRFTAYGLPANLLLVPLLLPLMMSGILTFLLSLVAHPLALIASAPAALLLHMVAWLVRTVAALHGADLRTPGPSLLTACALALLIALCVVLLRFRQRVPAWAAVLLACIAALGIGLFPREVTAPGAMEITAIDVGQGDSILLTAPKGQAMLIDAGGVVGPEIGPQQRGAATAFDTGENVVSPYLWHRGIARLDVLALSHAHMDHLGGMDAVLRNFRPRELWLSVDVPSARLHSLIDEAKGQGTAVRFLRAGTHLEWQELRVDVLGPQKEYVPGAAPANDDSLVLRAAYGRSSALLVGDAEHPSEDAMLLAHLLGPVTLLKVGHHGSMTSTGEPLLDALAPRVAVISCGRSNRFGHPRMPVLARLQQRHALTARTDTMGAVEYTLHADGTVTTYVPAAEE